MQLSKEFIQRKASWSLIPERFIYQSMLSRGICLGHIFLHLIRGFTRRDNAPPFTFSISSIVRARAFIKFCCFMIFKFLMFILLINYIVMYYRQCKGTAVLGDGEIFAGLLPEVVATSVTIRDKALTRRLNHVANIRNE